MSLEDEGEKQFPLRLSISGGEKGPSLSYDDARSRQPVYMTFPVADDQLATQVQESRNRFLQLWKDSFEDVNRQLEAKRGIVKRRTIDHEYWEGVEAIEELKSKGYIEHLREPTEGDLKGLFGTLLREIEIYRDLYGQIIEIKDEFRRTADLLSRLRQTLRKFDAAMMKPGTQTYIPRPLIVGLIQDVENSLQILASKQKQFLNQSLAYTTTELTQPFVVVQLPQDTRGKLEYFVPASVAELDHAMFGWKIPEDVTTRANLDTRLQMRLARLFCLRLTGLSWATASRLVILSYICAGLAAECAGKLVIRGSSAEGGSDRQLTVFMLEKKRQKLKPNQDLDSDAYFLQTEEPKT